MRNTCTVPQEKSPKATDAELERDTLDVLDELVQVSDSTITSKVVIIKQQLTQSNSILA